MNAGIQVDRLDKRFGDFHAVRDVSFEAREGAITALLGPSGSGKSTVLRMIAGLERPDAGRVWVGGEELTNASVQERRLGGHGPRSGGEAGPAQRGGPGRGGHGGRCRIHEVSRSLRVPTTSGAPLRSGTAPWGRRLRAGVARSYLTPRHGWQTIWRALANPGE